MTYVRTVIRAKRTCLQREEQGLEYTSKELVCALNWHTFLNHAVTTTERDMLTSLYFTAGGDWRKLRKPTYPFWVHQRMSLLDVSGAVKYFEGFRRVHNEVTYHAWCVLHGKVADFATKRELNGVAHAADVAGVLGQYPDYLEYVGVEVPRKLLENLLVDNGTYLPVISMYDSVYGDLGEQSLKELVL